VVCFSHDWSGDPLSKTHLMRLIARDNRVLWVNSIGYRAPTVSKADLSRAFRKLAAAARPLAEVEPNLFVLNPLAIPAYGRPLIRAFNQKLLCAQIRRAMRRLSFRRPINWTFNPAAAVVAGCLGEQLVLYHCVDEYTAFSGVAADSIGQLERQLLKRADAVIVSADRLYQSKAAYNPRTVIVRHGVDFDHFRRALSPQTTVAPELDGLPRPILGFFGLVADWVDVELMAAAARRFTHGSLVVLGKTTTDATCLQQLPNVHFFGRRPYEELASWCKGFDVALMPFRVNELTLAANPLKVREYLAAGLPVVSTAIPEVEILRHCRIAHNEAEFLQHIEQALADRSLREARSDAVRNESWAARLQEITEHLNAFGLLSGTNGKSPSPQPIRKVR
jgi:glycosyltransferase involved in cell wall biosynthesis